MVDVDNLPPRETTTIGIETKDVAKAAGDIEATAVALGGRKVDSDWAAAAQRPDGRPRRASTCRWPRPNSSPRPATPARVLSLQRDQAPAPRKARSPAPACRSTIATADPIVPARPGPGRQHPLGPGDERRVAAEERDVDRDRAVPGAAVGADRVGGVEDRSQATVRASQPSFPRLQPDLSREIAGGAHELDQRRALPALVGSLAARRPANHVGVGRGALEVRVAEEHAERGHCRGEAEIFAGAVEAVAGVGGGSRSCWAAPSAGRGSGR